jgi:formylglycine-generating enzyme
MRAPALATLALSLAGLWLCALPGDAHARRPARPEEIWRGLDPAREIAPARGVVQLRVPLAGRARIVGATFRMGSTDAEMQAAITLCDREVLKTLCSDQGLQNGIRAEGHAHQVAIDAFDLDRTEVTVDAYARCVSAGVCASAAFPPGDFRYDRPTLPVTHVSWQDAVTYCGWVGGRLPTEAEWELAARGTEGRQFPWGNLYNGHLCNHGSLWPYEGLQPAAVDGSDGFINLALVGSFPDGATPLGIHDLAGNAAEWVNDLFDTDDQNFGYPETPVGQPLVNPQGSQTGPVHVIRGGSFAEGAAWVRGAARGKMSASRAPTVGFRCAYSP